jgi:hypothetical protein
MKSYDSLYVLDLSEADRQAILLQEDLKKRSFFLADSAVLRLFNHVKVSYSAQAQDNLLEHYKLYLKHPYRNFTPNAGDIFFMPYDRKETSPAKTARVGFRWKEAGSSQAIKLSDKMRSALCYRDASLPLSDDPLCVYRTFHYNKTDGSRLLTMRIYALHAGGCACNACCKSRDAPRSGGVDSPALGVVLCVVLDDTVWRRATTPDRDPAAREAEFIRADMILDSP